jgi:hypothetical protein
MPDKLMTLPPRPFLHLVGWATVIAVLLAIAKIASLLKKELSYSVGQAEPTKLHSSRR